MLVRENILYYVTKFCVNTYDILGKGIESIADAVTYMGVILQALSTETN